MSHSSTQAHKLYSENISREFTNALYGNLSDLGWLKAKCCFSSPHRSISTGTVNLCIFTLAWLTTSFWNSIEILNKHLSRVIHCFSCFNNNSCSVHIVTPPLTDTLTFSWWLTIEFYWFHTAILQSLSLYGVPAMTEITMVVIFRLEQPKIVQYEPGFNPFKFVLV